MPGVYTMIQVFILMNSKLPQSHMRDTTVTGALRAHSDKQTFFYSMPKPVDSMAMAMERNRFRSALVL